MNKELIFNVVKPHLNSKNELTYSDFDNLFSSLENREKYAVIDLLAESGIELVDEKSTDDTYTDEHLFNSSENKPDKTIAKNEALSFDELISASNEFLIELYLRTKKEIILNALIIKNRKYIIKQANQADFYYNHNLSEEDLYQIATMGFVHGCERFNPDKGYNLLTYVTFWIKQALRREIMNTGFLIRLPVHKWEIINRINKIMSEHSSDEDINTILKNEGFSPKAIEEAMTLKSNYLNPQFLDTYISNDSDITLLDTIPSNADCLISDIPNPAKEIDLKRLKEDINIIFNSLSLRERDIIRLRFGIDDGRQRTLKEVGELFGVTRERIRQIEAKALRKLRHPDRIKNIIEYTDCNKLYTLKTDNKYLFKNEAGASYIPEISDIIKRVIELFPEETNPFVLYEKICQCAKQNSYNISSLPKDDIMRKLKEYLDKRR